MSTSPAEAPQRNFQFTVEEVAGGMRCTPAALRKRLRKYPLLFGHYRLPGGAYRIPEIGLRRELQLTPADPLPGDLERVARGPDAADFATLAS